MSYRHVLLVSSFLAAAPAIHAETLYVIEQLVVNLNSAPDGSGERVASIKSGDAVEVLDRQGDQVHVHLTSGAEGWVKKSYLSAEEPLEYRLRESRAEVEKLKQDVERLEAQLAARTSRGAQTDPSGASSAPPDPPASTVPRRAPAATGGPTATLAPTSAAVAQSAKVVPTAPPASGSMAGPREDSHGAEGTVSSPVSEPSYFMTPPEAPPHPTWHWALGSFVSALALGFALGWQMLDRRIRRKYGGLRIY